MPSPLKADDLVPLVAALSPHERTRLLRLILKPSGDDSSLYRATPPREDEFSGDEKPLQWESEGLESLA